MMTIGETRGLTTLLASIRADWPSSQILYEVNKLAEEGYTITDLTAACVDVASSKQYAVTILGIVVPEKIRERHQAAQPAQKRRRRFHPDDARICDVCTKPELVCQSTAANVGQLRDHDFISIEEADRQRTKARDPAAAIAEADLFTMPDDL